MSKDVIICSIVAEAISRVRRQLMELMGRRINGENITDFQVQEVMTRLINLYAVVGIDIDSQLYQQEIAILKKLVS